jgi:acetoin utilization deacetylase AcuC-like enzyme
MIIGPDRLLLITKKLQNRQLFPDYELEFSSSFDKADVALLGRVHSADYLAFVNDLSKKLQAEGTMMMQFGGKNGVNNSNALSLPSSGSGSSFFSSVYHEPVPFTPQVQRHLMRQNSDELKPSDSCDTSFSTGTLNAARRAAGAVAHAVDCILLGRNRNAFCCVRPPGHHSGNCHLVRFCCFFLWLF